MHQSHPLYYFLRIILVVLANSCGCKNFDTDHSSNNLYTKLANDLSLIESPPTQNQGIPNIGASCYMNATLQPVFTLFKNSLRKMKNNSTKHTGSTSDLATSAINLLDKVTNPLPEIDKEKLRSSSQEFFKNLTSSKENGGLDWQGGCGTQEDAEELLHKLLDWMNLPQVQTKYQIIDPKTGKKRMLSAVDSDSMLNLAIPSSGTKQLTMQEVVDNFLQPEEGGMDVKWEEADSSSIKVTKVPLLQGLNNLHNDILVVHLKRALHGSKNTAPVNNPFDITIKKEQTLDLNSNKSYQLISFIQHIGSTGSSGHYIAYVRVSSQWVKYDDENVSTVSNDQAEAAAKGSHIFFYKSTIGPKQAA